MLQTPLPMAGVELTPEGGVVKRDPMVVSALNVFASAVKWLEGNVNLFFSQWNSVSSYPKTLSKTTGLIY